MSKEHIRALIYIFLFLSVLSLLFWNGAPLRVHAVGITAFFIAFVVPGVLSFNLALKKQVAIWLAGGAIGLFLWDDVGLSYVIGKWELFTGWPIFYPLGLVGLCLLQVAVKWVDRKKGL